jgi:hypothetical protein
MQVNATTAPASAEPANASAAFVFFGASRFEGPEIGRLFRRDEHVYEVMSVEAIRNSSSDFARRWRFLALCRVRSPRLAT